jgi:hypothetical protein
LLRRLIQIESIKFSIQRSLANIHFRCNQFAITLIFINQTVDKFRLELSHAANRQGLIGFVQSMAVGGLGDTLALHKMNVGFLNNPILAQSGR